MIYYVLSLMMVSSKLSSPKTSTRLSTKVKNISIRKGCIVMTMGTPAEPCERKQNAQDEKSSSKTHESTEEITTITTNCDTCEGKTDAKSVCMMGFGAHNKIMIIGDAPTYNEDMSGEYLRNHASTFLLETLDRFGVNFVDCYYTKAIKCRHINRDTIKKDTVKNCMDILVQEIEMVNPEYILLLGAIPIKIFTGKTVKSARGKLFYFNGIKVIGTVSPAVVVERKNELKGFLADITYFVNTIKGFDEPKDFKYSVVTKPLLGTVRDSIQASEAIAYDIETTGLDETDPDGELLMISIATDTECFVLPFDDTTKSFLNEVLGKGTPWQKVAHNAKFDNRWLRSRGVDAEVTFDTYLAAYLLDVNMSHGLKNLAKLYLGATDYDKDIVFKKGLSEEEFKAMHKYNALDSYYTLKLYHLLKDRLKKDGRLWKVFTYIVMAGEKVLQGIEARGVYVDKTRLGKVKDDYLEKQKEVDAKILSMIPSKYEGNINLNSPKQLATLLYDDLGLPCTEYTPKGAQATGRSALVRLTDKHELPQLILERKKYEKAITSFLDPWAEYLKNTDRLHPTYNIARTATGRLSAENPNLQQVPRDSTIRSLISAPPGKKLIEADYSQIELRTAAFVANAHSMKEAYRHNEDLHIKTASNIAKVTPDKVTKEMRTSAKAVNFGFLFGMWWKSFKAYAYDSYGIVVSDEEAELARNTYFRTYPELERWHKRQKEFAKKHKYVRTATGRIRHLPNIDSPNRDLSGSAERQAINTVVQSLASDMTLLAMILIDKNLNERYKDRAYIVGQVHDSIIVEVDDTLAAEVARVVKTCMEGVPIVLKKYFGINWDLPLEADVCVSDAWGS